MASRLRGRWALVLTALFVAGAAAQEQCAACHGPDGNSVRPGVPSIAGQPQLFIENQLVLIREGLRPSPQMLPFVKDLSDEAIVALARHFSSLPMKAAANGPTDATLMAQGAALVQKHRCGSCHLPDFSGRNQIPRLAGQREDYLAPVLREFRDHPRPGGDTIMAAALYGVSDAEIRALAHYLARAR